MAENEEKHGEHAEGEAHGAHGHGGGHGGHGGGHEEGHEGAPEWLISFADNVALMMGFFVILLAMNMQAPKAHGGIGSEENNAGYLPALDTVIAIREAFNSPIDPNNPNDLKLWEHMKRKGQGKAEDLGPQGNNRDVESVMPTDLFNLGGTIPFEEASSELTESGLELAKAIAGRLKGSRWIIEVRGHSSPYETFRDVNAGLELSFKRSQVVANALVEAGLRWEQLHVVACADSDRKVARPSGREQDRVNRRVEVIVTKETMPDDPYTKGEGE